MKQVRRYSSSAGWTSNLFLRPVNLLLLGSNVFAEFSNKGLFVLYLICIHLLFLQQTFPGIVHALEMDSNTQNTLTCKHRKAKHICTRKRFMHAQFHWVTQIDGGAAESVCFFSPNNLIGTLLNNTNYFCNTGKEKRTCDRENEVQVQDGECALNDRDVEK